MSSKTGTPTQAGHSHPLAALRPCLSDMTALSSPGAFGAPGRGCEQALVSLGAPARVCAPSPRPRRHTCSSKALLLCPKGQTVAKPSPYCQKGAEVPFGLRSRDSRLCPRGWVFPRAGPSVSPSSRRGASVLEQCGGAPRGGRQGSSLVGRHGRASRDKQLHGKATSKRKPENPDPQAARCPSA